MIKPASGNCNLRCKYCFYHDLAANRQTKSFGVMGAETLEILVQRAFADAELACSFAFQGGEPTLAGLDFYRRFVALVSRYNVRKLKVALSIQTNGLALDRDWAEFLAANKFLVGISLDGPGEIHDLNRVDGRGEGSYARVMRAIDLLDRYKVEYNILFVVNAAVARHADRVLRFFEKHSFRYLQFIPCLDPLGEAPGAHEYSLRPDRYAAFLKSAFDRWHGAFMRGEPVSIRHFDNLAGMVLGHRPEACGMSGECTCQLVIEADGGVYPCDFYVNDAWHLGNIRAHSLEDLRRSEKARFFVESSRHIDPKCKECRWYALCRGGCRRSREPFVDGKPSLYHYCSSMQDFFEHAGDGIMQVARVVAAGARRG